MAAKKWPKWLVGFSSVASFTGFLFLIQQTTDSGTMSANGPEPAPVDPIGSAQATGMAAVQPEPISVKTGTPAATAKTFAHSRSEFQEISTLSAEQKSARELQLELLDWDGPADNATVVAPIKTVTPPAAQQQTSVAPSNTNQITVAPAPAPKPKSVTKTRRS